MKGKIFKTAIAAALTASVIGVQAPNSAQAAEGDFELTIMHTNDTHANLDQVAKRAGIVNDIRSKKPNNLLLDAGDVFSGTLYFNTFQGQADAEMMKLMDYDAMTFGNHEFDLGANDGHQALSEFMFAAGVPFVSANADFSQNPYIKDYQNPEYTRVFEDGEIYNGIIKEIDGEEVGIFGLTTAETKDISSPGDVTFSNYIEAAKEAVAAFEAEGVDKIIALTHIGLNDSAKYDNDMTLAAEVQGIDIIVGGHTHTKIQPPIVVENGDPIVIVQANEYGKFLGQLDVTFNDAGVITSHTGVLHEVAKTALAPDTEVAAALKKYSDEIDAIKTQPTGAEAKVALNGGRSQTPGDGVGVRASETNLGNLITDGMLAKAKTVDAETVIAVQNGGGIRASIDAGPITYGEVLTTLPFGNSLAIMNLTGAELKAALEHSVSEYPNELGAFLHVAGMKFTFDPAKPAGSRVTSVSVKEGDSFTALNLAKNYKVATNTFIAAGGDGFTSFGTAYKDGRVSEPGFTDFDMFVDYITSLNEVNPKVEGRIVAGPAEEPAVPGKQEADPDMTGETAVVKSGEFDVEGNLDLNFSEATVKELIASGKALLIDLPTANLTLSKENLQQLADTAGKGFTLSLAVDKAATVDGRPALADQIDFAVIDAEGKEIPIKFTSSATLVFDTSNAKIQFGAREDANGKWKILHGKLDGSTFTLSINEFGNYTVVTNKGQAKK
ncbi:bifunctional metallophosphatase/5'-nucleotidase [Planococcus glaciei]|uniref:bifunctional metallophosphatase/5'-nucleotidase n=1 Tax=Planococcus glaciei TaxID=459472 RepID=UPI001C7334B0|nr:5'-nucleotidase C-terminal domain-containing protein [Planococcus glaciei]MBX0316852.1 5'-nucleotidase C-terminal domain-containing protein [Planococcus glaciei]